MQPIVVLAVRHRPFEIAVLFASFLSSLISSLVGPTRTIQAIENLVPGYGWIFYGGVMLGSGLALASIFMKIPDALLWERIGLMILVTFFCGYSGVALVLLGAIGFSGAFYILAFATGGVFRIIQLNRDIKALKGTGGER